MNTRHSDHYTDDANELVACEVCFTEIPLSEAMSNEASDYVHYYCGLECYAKWHSRVQRDEQENDLNNTDLPEETD
jgi:hypothetical protein